MSRDVWLYLAASGMLAFTVLHGIFAVLFNLYLLRLGYGLELVGLVNAIGLLGSAVFALPAGMVTQRLGIRHALTLGAGVAVLCHGLQLAAELLPAAWRMPWIVTNRVLAAAGLTLFFVNSDPFLSVATSPDERNEAFSLRMAVSTLAGFLGSVVGGALPGALVPLIGSSLESPAPYRAALAIGALCGVPAVYLMARIRSDGAGADSPVTVDAPASRSGLPIGLIATLSLVMALRSASVGTSMVFFNVYLDAALRLPPAQIGAIFGAVQLAAVPVSLAMPYLAARWGNRRVVLYGSLGVAASALPLALIPHWAAAALGRLGIFGLAAVSDAALGRFQMDLVPARWRSVLSGAAGAGLGVSWSAMAYGGGYVIATFGYGALFALAGALTLAGTLVFWGAFRGRDDG